MALNVHETPPPGLDDETQAKFDDLDKVDDLRPVMQLDAPSAVEQAPIDTPDLLATENTPVALAVPTRKREGLQQRIPRLFKDKLRDAGRAVAPKHPHQHWYDNAAMLWLCGTLAILAIGLVTFAILTLLPS